MSRLFVVRLSLFLFGVFLLSACGGGDSTPTVDIQAVITQTMQAVATEAQSTLEAAVPTPVPAINTPLPTETPLPTQTPAPTETPLPAVPETSTPAAAAASNAIAYVNQSTNCRSGPATTFPLIYTALAGESLKIVSKTTLEDYVIVEVPTGPGQTCWLWTEYVTVQGDVSALPVTTPPPTPTPAVRYSLSFERIEPCTGWSLVFKVTNTGAKTLQSYTMVATDQTKDNTETTTLNHFTERIACKYQEELASLDPGQSGYIYENDFSYDPKGHYFLIYVNVCSNNDLEGECVTQGFFLTP
jgi:uncharacterized protein YraI